MQKIIKNNNKRMVRFSTLTLCITAEGKGMKIGIVRFSTLTLCITAEGKVMKTGIVSASSYVFYKNLPSMANFYKKQPITNTQRRVSASTSAMKTGLDSGKNKIDFTELFVNTSLVAKRALTIDASHPSSKVENLEKNFCD
jgi:hypothetical protein